MSSEQSTVVTEVHHRIVVGIDGSDASLAALEWAARQAEFTNSSLEIVAAWEWPTGFGWSFIPNGFDPEGEVRQTVEPIFASVRSNHPQLTVT